MVCMSVSFVDDRNMHRAVHNVKGKIPDQCIF
jgi:hypothetical protein